MVPATIKIPSELFALAESSRFEGVIDMPSLTIGPDDYLFGEPLTWEVDVTNTGSALLVEGSVCGTGEVACSRCLERVSYDFDGAIEGYFLIGDAGCEELADEEDELGEDEFDVLPADHLIDLEPLIRAALIVDAPNAPLCRDDCAGLCPACGADLNNGSCGCARDEALDAFDRASNPFSSLVDLEFE